MECFGWRRNTAVYWAQGRDERDAASDALSCPLSPPGSPSFLLSGSCAALFFFQLRCSQMYLVGSLPTFLDPKNKLSVCVGSRFQHSASWSVSWNQPNQGAKATAGTTSCKVQQIGILCEGSATYAEREDAHGLSVGKYNTPSSCPRNRWLEEVSVP